ncbi:hypothetical protein [Burkholderia metallica]|uniref:hypothetical protein n=1 Tax=Burkholderia metallica TaxID=488729 RepID=UPI001CF27F24|nr:hypothetical protein [Burkholderia metallica]MCA8002751.1 hypothetical protein [Burkholderia metallica]
MDLDTTARSPEELNAKLARFIEKVEMDRDFSLAVIERVGVRTHKRIAWGYRKLFPLSMATLVVIGMTEYQRRTERYQDFTRLALKSQAKLGAVVNR